MYPFPSLGGFLFTRAETAIWGTDQGWNITPSYSRQRPLGAAADVITTLAIGSADRTFECYLTPVRFQQLLAMVNTKVLFTDWTRPTPDSRQAFITEVVSVDQAYSYMTGPNVQRKLRVRVSLATA